MKTLFAALLLAAAAAPAAAETYTLDLTGTVADTEFGSFTFGGQSYQTGRLVLAGLTPLDLVEGDVIEAEIVLDEVFQVPGATSQFFGFNLFNTQADTVEPTSNTGAFTFFNSSGPTGVPGDTLLGNCSNCLSLITSNGGSPFSFDRIQLTMTITALTPSPFTVDGASISYQLSNPVPEPASWALMIAGFAIAGTTARRRTNARATLA
jgi:hypothetical protein